MKYKIYIYKKPGYHAITISECILEELDIPEIDNEFNSIDMAMMAIQEHKQHLIGFRLTILPYIYMQYEQ